MDASTNRRPSGVGSLLRDWRQRRRFSQMALALEADISPKHLSFVESGRARPSREMLLHLADCLEVPLRDRNRLLVAAGFAPAFQEHALDDPAFADVRQAIDQVLTGHEPYPALAVDRHWTLVAANRGIAPLIATAAAHLLRPPVNVLRLSLHPDGLAPRILNLSQWRAHILSRLRRQADHSADPMLSSLLEELRGYPDISDAPAFRLADDAPLAAVVPLHLLTEHGTLSFISTTMVFGMPVDITSAELAIESFFPADAVTAERLRGARG